MATYRAAEIRGSRLRRAASPAASRIEATGSAGADANARQLETAATAHEAEVTQTFDDAERGVWSVRDHQTAIVSYPFAKRTLVVARSRRRVSLAVVLAAPSVLAAHGPPGREPSGGDDPPPPDPAPLDPPARVLYAHAAAFRGDTRVAAWLESWADEALKGRAS